MADLRGFDANQVEPQAEYDALPAGKYTVVIADSEMKPTKAGTGEYLQLAFEVIDGPHKGRMIWARLNLRNPNAVAVQMAQSELSAICRAVGVLTPANSNDLHNLPLVITLKQQKRKDTGEFENVIAGYAMRDASPPPIPPAASATSTANQPPAAPPWRRG